MRTEAAYERLLHALPLLREWSLQDGPPDPLTASVTKTLTLLSALRLCHAYSLSQDSQLLPLLARYLLVPDRVATLPPNLSEPVLRFKFIFLLRQAMGLFCVSTHCPCIGAEERLQVSRLLGRYRQQAIACTRLWIQ